VARFRFNLERVLEQRQHAEQMCQRTVAELEIERLGLENTIRECQERLAREQSGQRDALVGGHLLEVRHQVAASGAIRQEAQRAVIELAGLHRRLERARHDLLEAMRDRKAIELLRERRYHEWRMQQEKRDVAAMDEIAVVSASSSARDRQNGSSDEESVR
jgi:flagellar protein FliJ